MAEIDVAEIDAVKFCRRELGFRINGDDAASAWQMWTAEATPMAGLHGKEWAEAAGLQLRRHLLGLDGDLANSTP